MSKTEHYDKIWSRAVNKKYCDGWERTFGDKKPKRKKPKRKKPDKRRYHAGVVCIPEPGNFVRAGELPKTMKALAGYLEREKANG